MRDQIKYRKGYKYQLAETYVIQTGITGYSVDTEFLFLGLSGTLRIKSGYAWDGPSGPTFDTKDFMRGSLVHDAFYELVRKGFLTKFERRRVDALLRDLCIEDGMPSFRARYVYEAVKRFGESYADPQNKKEILIAPEE